MSVMCPQTHIPRDICVGNTYHCDSSKWVIRYCFRKIYVIQSYRGEVINGGFGLVLDGSEVSLLHTVKKHTYLATCIQLKQII